MGAARLERRPGGVRGADRARRQQSSSAAPSRLESRLVTLGFPRELTAHLRDGHERRRLPVLASARGLGGAAAACRG